jgi:hypothetical protein
MANRTVARRALATNRVPSEPRNQDVHFERTDWSVRISGGIIVGTLVGVWILSGFVYLYFVFLAHQRAVSSPSPLPIEVHGNPMPPEPRLQASPREDLKAMRTREDWTLNHYSWIDRPKGVVEIPIERAIQMVAQRGIPPQKAPANLVLSLPQAGTRLTGFEGKVEPEPR